MAKMLQIGEILRGPGGNLLVGIRVMDAINGFPCGPGMGGRSKSGVERVIFGRHLGMLGSLEHRAKMVRNGEVCRTSLLGLLVGIWVIATINVLSMGSISMAKSGFGIGKPVVWCRVGLLGMLQPRAKKGGMYKMFSGWGRGLQAGIRVIDAVNVLPLSTSGGSKTNGDVELARWMVQIR